MVEYLKSKDVWAKSIPEIAELANNDLIFLKAHFEGVDTALAIHRIKEDKPPESKACPECGILKGCGCTYITGEFSEFIEH